jgi:tRNA nucleotidyltransferase/poly(A) polymerase
MATTDIHPRRQFAIDVLRTLRDAGFEAYWAGGCVRDHLLGREPKDFDVATNATPEQVRKLFGRRRTLAVGAAFGVIVVVGQGGAGQVEVTTFRHDGRYSDGRHPDSVTFGTAEEDVRRRDFTINGMLYDPLADRVLDWVGGQEDLRSGIIRAIGHPAERFAEDKLRMLRAVRFSARFGFRLDPQTRGAIGSMAGEIAVVSVERIAQEMRAILVHPSRAEGIELCRQAGLLAVILPEAKALESPTPNESCGGDCWQHTLKVLARLQEPSFPLALAALMHAVGVTPNEGAGIAEAAFSRWRLSNDEIDRATWLVRHHRDLRDARQVPWPRLQRILITDGIHELVALHEADLIVLKRDLDPVAYCREQLGRPRKELDPPPIVTGHDLIRHGVPRGKVYQSLLDQVRDEQLEGRVTDKRGALALVDQLMARREVPPSPHVWRN